MFEKMSGESLDITKENIEKLKKLFPEVVSEGKVDVDKLKDIFTKENPDEIAQDERYNFTWSGKRRSIHIAQQPSKGTLLPVKEKSKNWDTTKNLYIEGDNLEVLKLLQKSYFQKVKMIYIDPPYNTGNDFVYKDNFKDGIENYLEQTGQVDSDGNKLSTNTESNGRFHSDWLNMMFPRLKLAKNLLNDEGVIFISIDDTEATNLKKMCDEIFGEESMVGWIIWQHSIQPKGYLGTFSVHHNHILCYKKSGKFMLNSLERTVEDNKAYSNPDNDPNGPWRSGDVRNALYRPNLIYNLMTPSGKIIKPYKNGWRWSKETMEEKIKKGEIIFSADETRIIHKIYLKNLEGRSPETIWFSKDVGSTREAMNELKKIFESSPFDTPKPTKLIKRMLNLLQGTDYIVLDFFSGSATTAHSVMKLNAEDEGNRKFIMVQLPEQLDEKLGAYKDGYRTICDIGEERIRRVGENIKRELIMEKEKEGMLSEIMDCNYLDIGFKVFKLDRSNLKEWDVDFEHIGEQLKWFKNNIEEGRSEEDIVYEIMLKSGLDLNYPIEKISYNNGENIFKVAYGALFICLDDQVTSDIADKLIELKNKLNLEKTRVVFKDLGFKDDQTKINVYETLKANGFDELMSI